MQTQVIPPKVHKILLEHTLKAFPHECVGLITEDERIIILSNQSESPQDSFEVSKTEIVEKLSFESNFENITLWHSHPSGGIGPSKSDLNNKTAFHNHLVVTLVDGDLVFTWY